MKLVKSKRRTAVIAVAAAVALIAAGADSVYGHAHSSDYTGHWSEPLVKSAVEQGLLQGYDNGSYRPDKAITRAELAVLLARTLPSGEKAVGGIFKDVETGSWYAEAVEKVVKAGLLTVDEEGRFRPGATVTRLDGATVLARLLGWNGDEPAAWPEGIADSQAAPEGSGGVWLAQAAAESFIEASSDGYILPYRPWTRSEALYALLKAKGSTLPGVRPSAFAAWQTIEGVVHDTGAGFTLETGNAGTVTGAVYALSDRKTLAGTKGAAGIDGIQVTAAGLTGLVPAENRLIVESIALPSEHAVPDKLEGILLEGHHSNTDDPKAHKKLCLLMPDCAASGFGISVLQSDGSYRYYKFDEAGHKLAAILLDSISAADNVQIRAEGTIAGDVFQVTRISQIHDGQAAGKETPADHTDAQGHNHEEAADGSSSGHAHDSHSTEGGHGAH